MVEVTLSFDLSEAREWLSKRGIDTTRVSDERLGEVIREHFEGREDHLKLMVFNQTQFTLFSEQNDFE